MLTPDRVRELFNYDPLDGVLRWRVTKSNRAYAGSPAGCRDACGYLRVGVDRRLYYAHQVIWLLVYGRPCPRIDHRDGDPTNNRLSNLRPASASQNGANAGAKTSGYKGVWWTAGRWRAGIKVKRKAIHLGYFDTPEAAAQAYDEAALRHFGEFAKLNFPPKGEGSDDQEE
jgi:hypothetical protein